MTQLLPCISPDSRGRLASRCVISTECKIIPLNLKIIVCCRKHNHRPRSHSSPTSALIWLHQSHKNWLDFRVFGTGPQLITVSFSSRWVMANAAFRTLLLQPSWQLQQREIKQHLAQFQAETYVTRNPSWRVCELRPTAVLSSAICMSSAWWRGAQTHCW